MLELQLKMVQQSALNVIKKGGSSNKKMERNVFNVPQEQIDIVEIIKLHVDNGLELRRLFLLKSIREYPIDEIERHEDLIISCYRAADRKLVQVKLRVSVHMDSGIKVVTISDIPFFSPKHLGSMTSKYNDQERFLRAQRLARQNEVGKAVQEMRLLLSSMQSTGRGGENRLQVIQNQSSSSVTSAITSRSNYRCPRSGCS